MFKLLPKCNISLLYRNFFLPKVTKKTLETLEKHYKALLFETHLQHFLLCNKGKRQKLFSSVPVHCLSDFMEILAWHSITAS